MRVRAMTVAGLGLLAACYAAYPCVTLWRLQTALANGDTGTLRTLVDWTSVRQGIDADLKAARPADELPLFGAHFMRKIVVKAAVTPQDVVAALRRPSRSRQAGSALSLSDVRLDGPGRLLLTADDLRFELALGRHGWQVTRVWLPTHVLRQAMAQAG